MKTKTMLAGLTAASLIGCSTPNSSHAGADEPNSPNQKAKTPVPSNVISKMDKDQQIAVAKEHLAQYLQVDLAEIELTSSGSVTWRSGAMGCPKPGRMYTQALVPGRLIMLKVGGKAYRYHASTTGAPAYCPAERAESPSPRAGDI